jgi:hypothetical protein
VDFSAKNPVFLEKDRKHSFYATEVQSFRTYYSTVYGINRINKFKNGFAYEKRNITVFLKIQIC